VKRTNVKTIPPAKAALEQHVRRAVYQGGYVESVIDNKPCASFSNKLGLDEEG